MRPPEHWHLRRRRSRRLWWALGAGAAVVLVGILTLTLRPSGGDTDANAVFPDPTACALPNGCASGAPSFGAEAPAPPVRISGRAAAIIEDSCGTLLYGRNENLRLPPASLTKIATALVAAEYGQLSATIDVTVNSGLLVVSTDSTVMGLEPGLRMSLRDLLYGLLLVSGNDAAVAIAEGVGGTIAGFVQLMNAKAAELELGNTHFANPHGLDEPDLYTSAYDIALLGRALLAEPELAAIVRTKRYEAAWDGPELWNGNELLDLYPGVVGVKIGFTEGARQTIVAAAERDGRRLIVSVLGSQDRYSDAIALFDWAFAETASPCSQTGILSELAP